MVKQTLDLGLVKMKDIQTILASYILRSYTDTDIVYNMTENDIIVGCDSIGNTWVLMKQTKRRKF